MKNYRLTEEKSRELLTLLSSEVVITVSINIEGARVIMEMDGKVVFMYSAGTISECVDKLLEVYKDDQYDLEDFLQRMIVPDSSSTIRVTTLQRYLVHCGAIKSNDYRIKGIMEAMGYPIEYQYIDGRKTEVYQGCSIDLSVEI